jgi:hypothetical protein
LDTWQQLSGHTLRGINIMATLTYWYAECIGDHNCYSIVTKTKREAEALRAQRPDDFEPVEKRVFQYRDAFDLFDWATSEGGGRGMGQNK